MCLILFIIFFFHRVFYSNCFNGKYKFYIEFISHNNDTIYIWTFSIQFSFIWCLFIFTINQTNEYFINRWHTVNFKQNYLYINIRKQWLKTRIGKNFKLSFSTWKKNLVLYKSLLHVKIYLWLISLLRKINICWSLFNDRLFL